MNDQRPVKSGDVTRFTDGDLVRSLPEDWLVKIGSALNSDLPQNWISLATGLGLDNEEIERIRVLQNPGYEALRMWKTGEGRTIRVLQNVLVCMERSDVIDILTKARLDPTIVTIVIRFQGEITEDVGNEVPYKTILLNYIRPKIHRKFGTLLMKGNVFSVKLRIPSGSNLSWTSAVGEFRGRQIEVEMVQVKEKEKRAGTEYSIRERHLNFSRDCLSYFEEENLSFDYLPNEQNSEPKAEASVSVSGLFSSSIEFENISIEEDRHMLRRSVSEENNDNCSKSFPGFHPEIPLDDSRRTRTEEILQPHLDHNGVYIFRKGIVGGSPLTLSVIFNRKVLHYSVKKKGAKGNTTKFFISSDCEFDSINHLIDYYKRHSLSLSTFSTQIAHNENLFLTRPVL